MIANGTARLIASEYHDGQASALYSLASTGRLIDRDLPRAVAEVEHEIDRAFGHLEAPDTDLERLLGYLHDDAHLRGIAV